MSSIFDRVVVTGGKGMLAHAFSKLLAERNISAEVLDRASLDVSDQANVRSVFGAIRPTLVLNCAAYTKVDLAEKETDLANAVNGTGAGHLAEFCQSSGAMLVHFSTDYVFDGTLRRPLRPDDPVGPASAYGKSKLLGEQLIQKFAPTRSLILRTAWLYGPNGPNFVQTMLNAGRAGKPLRVISDQFGCPTFTFDLANATLNLLDRAAVGVFHVSNAGETNWFEFTRAIMDEFAVTPTSLDPITSDDWRRIKPDSAVRPAYSVLDVTPYEKTVGHPMPEWRDGLKRYHAIVG